MRYTPDAPPRNPTPDQLAEYLLREFDRISATLDHPEATQINYGKEVKNVADGPTLTIKWKAGQKQRIELEQDCTIAFAPPEGVCNLMLRLVYSDDVTPTLPCDMHWTGGVEPTWSATTGAVDVIAMYFDGTHYHSTASIDSKSACVIPG
jgi:hypothetical protein